MIAQRCQKCKEISIRAERIKVCMTCGAPMPVAKPEPTKSYRVSCAEPNEANGPKTWKEFLSQKNLLWQEWKDAEPERPVGEPSTEVIKEFLTVNEETSHFYNLVYGFLSKNNSLIKAKETTTETLCDFGFFCRELESLFDELRKESKARKELCGSICAMRKTQEAIADPTIKLKINGQYCTGTPDVKLQAKLPVKMTEEYFAITDYFKIPREVAAAGAVRLDWKGTGKFLTELAASGQKTPEGFGQKYPTYVTVFRRRRKVVTN